MIGRILYGKREELPVTPFLKLSRRNFITTMGAAAGSALIPRLAFAQDPVVNTTYTDGKAVHREQVRWKVHPFPMKQVRLGNGPCTAAMEGNRGYLDSLPPDRLLHTFRVNAGLPSSALPLGGVGSS